MAIRGTFAHAGRRYTGRHWFGNEPGRNSGLVSPFEGKEALEYAKAFGLASYLGEETGFVAMVIGNSLIEHPESPTTSKIEGGNETKSTGQNFGLTYTQGKLMVGAAYGTSENETTTVRAAVSANTNNSSLLSLNTITAQATDIAPVSATTQVNQVTAAVTARTTKVEVKNQETLAGASYDFGFAKLGYTYSAKKAKDLTSDLLDRKAHSVNATVPLSAKVTAWANYAEGDQKIAVTNEYDMKAMQVGARYAFSKRTDAYAIYGQTKFDNKASGAIDTKVTQYAFGLRHQF
jgi:predicted porin